MRWYRSNFPLVGMVVVFCLLLSSCGSEDELAQPELAPTTIRWVTWETDNDSESVLIGKFQEEYPQIDFERTASLFSPIAASIKEVPQPDLINVDAGWDLAQLARSGEIADLTELWVESGLTENVPIALQQVTSFQDRQFYIPVGVGWKAIYYNKQIFADYNLSPPETWEEFLAICETLLANGEVPLSISGVEPVAIHGWFEYLNLRINGAQFHRDLLAGRERYDDPRVRLVMETWQTLFVNGYFIARSDKVNELASLTSIIRSDNGKLESEYAVMVLATTYGYGNLPAPFQSEIDFFRFPIIDPSIAVAEVVEPFGYLVPVGAEHLPSTLVFLKYLSSSQAQLIAAQAPMFLSAYYAPARSDVDTEALSPVLRKALNLISEADETVISATYVLPDQMENLVATYFRGFVRQPADIDLFISKLEEVRQQMVDRGVLLME